eukprot:TRINITY_DN1031_c0_g1_i2.p1 TRINITY_DN1031_c0_g1~~TRINITY_DN1031_c0_g1_i2.p1  ORF type:complete len:297 (+),score=59.50 TRINITY_DN1031_c0_g1_i2:38-928(+)
MSTSCPVGQFVLSITAMNLGNAPLSAFVSPLQPSRAPVAAPAEILRSRQPAATGAGAEVLLGAQESSAAQNAASAHPVAVAAISAIGGCCLGFSFRAPRRGARLALKAGDDVKDGLTAHESELGAWNKSPEAMDGGLWSPAKPGRRKDEDASPFFAAANDFEDHNYIGSGDVAKRRDEEPIDTTGLPDVIEMDQHARADLVERLTKEGMKLIEAGKVDEAQEKFAKMNRIVALFERLTRPPEDESKPKRRYRTDAEVMGTRSEEHVLATLRRELDKDDFVNVFGGQARHAGFIGGW